MKILSAEFVKGVMSMDALPEDGMPEIVFAGRSNVGKSSLQNALLGRKNMVRTSKTPGKTLEINYYAVNKAFYFVDLPGLGYAKVSKGKRIKLGKLISNFLEKSPNIKAVFYLVDIKTMGTDIDRSTIQFLQSLDIPFQVIGTKTDRFNQKETAAIRKKLPENLDLDELPLCVSAHKKKGLDQMWEQIVQVIV